MRLVEKIGVEDPVCSEVPEAIAQLTPRSKQANGFCVADNDWPHDTFCLLPALVTVSDTQLPSGPNPGTSFREVKPVPDGSVIDRCAKGRLSDEGAQRGWDRGGDLREQIPRGDAECSVTPFGNPLCTEYRRLQLLWCQHERRHVVSPVQNVPDTNLTTNGHALACQIGDVTVDGSHRHLELCRHGFRSYRPA